MTKKKILFIIPSLVGGGALKTVSNLSKEFQNKYDVTIVGLYKSDKQFDYDGRLIELGMSYPKNIISKIANIIRAKKMLRNLKEKESFDYSVSFLVISDIINILSKTNNQEKTIVSIRNIESIEYKNKLYRRLQVKYASKHADYIVAISKEVEDDMKANFNVPQEKIRTIYNPCILNYKSSAIDRNIFVPGKTAITLGGLKHQKGQWHLIRAFSEVAKQIPDAKLLIFGRGDLEQYLKELIKGLKLEKNVSLMGYVIGPYDYVKQADVFVFSSLYEGLGNAMMEALKCGAPVISTDYTSGAREILAPKTDYKHKTKTIDYAEYGVLVPNFDGEKHASNDPLTKEEEMMAEAITKMLSDKKLNSKYRKQSARRASDFAITEIAKEWYGLFERLSSKGAVNE